MRQDLQQRPALRRHTLGHREDEFIAFDSANECERNPCIPTGRLNDHRAWLKLAGRFRRFYHGKPNAIFNTTEWIEELTLHQDGGIILGTQSIESDQGRLTDRLRDVVIDATHATPL